MSCITLSAATQTAAAIVVADRLSNLERHNLVRTHDVAICDYSVAMGIKRKTQNVKRKPATGKKRKY